MPKDTPPQTPSPSNDKVTQSKDLTYKKAIESNQALFNANRKPPKDCFVQQYFARNDNRRYSR